MGELPSDLESERAKRNLPGLGGFAAAGVVAVGVAFRYHGSAAGIVAGFAALALVLLAAVDLEQRRIPNVIVLPAALIVLAGRVGTADHRQWVWFAAAFGTGLVFFVLAVIYPAGLGMGDVKLALLLGAACGGDVVPALFLGTVSAALVALALIARHGSEARKRALPYAPFLSFGAVVVLLVLRP